MTRASQFRRTLNDEFPSGEISIGCFCLTNTQWDKIDRIVLEKRRMRVWRLAIADRFAASRTPIVVVNNTGSTECKYSDI